MQALLGALSRGQTLLRRSDPLPGEFAGQEHKFLERAGLEQAATFEICFYFVRAR
jgi:hypothetical protein